MIYRLSTSTRSTIHNLVRGVSYDSVEFHGIRVRGFPVGFSLTDFFYEVGRLLSDLVDEIFEVSRIDSYISESDECTPRDTLGHGSLADDIYILCDDLIPYLEMILSRHILSLTLGEAIYTRSISAIRHIEWIDSRLGVHLEDTGIGAIYPICHLSLIYISRGYERIFVLCIPPYIPSETVAHMHIYHSPWSEYGFFIRIFE